MRHGECNEVTAERTLVVRHGALVVYPCFQFDEDGRLRVGMSELLAVLPQNFDGSNRDAALWLFSPDAALRGRTAAEAFRDEPRAVIDLARVRRDGGDEVD